MMKKIIFSLMLLISLCQVSNAQNNKDLFSASGPEITWLGIDYSQVKLIGDFSQFAGAGEVSPPSLKTKYFPAWNNLVLNERTKYDIQGALRKENIQYDISEVTAKNTAAKLEDMEALNSPNYTQQQIQELVNSYSFAGKTGMGILFFAECLNKSSEEAYFHVAIINLSTKQIFIHERMRAEPSGIGLRNYWAGSVYEVIKSIEKNKYKSWKSQYAKK